MSSKVLVIGLDGTSFNILDPLIRSKRLPNICQLVKDGQSHYLNSTIPSNTPVAWTSMTTGKNPGKHGIFGFFKYDQEDKKVVSSLDNKSLTIWDLLSIYGKSSLVINIPYTWPPHKINGAIACFESSPADTGDRTSTLAEPPSVDKYIKEHQFDRIAVFHSKTSPNLRRFNEIVELETEFALKMTEQFNWDLLFIVFFVTDTVIHMYPSRLDLIATVYESVDRAVGQLMQLIDLEKDQIFITSDHGTKTFKYGYPIPAFLRKQRLLHLRPAVNLRTLLSYVSIEFLKDASYNLFAKILNVDPNILYHTISKLYPTKPNKKADVEIEHTEKLTLNNLIHEEKSALLVYDENSRIDVLLKINEKLYAKALRHKFLEKILENVNHKKRQVIKNGWIPEELYSGPYLKNAPDLILEMHEDLAAVITPISYYRNAQIFPFMTGGHLRQGIFIAAGKDIAPTQGVRMSVNIYDITPTILHSLNLPIPKSMDGKVLLDLYHKESVSYRLPQYSDINTQRQATEERKVSVYTPEEQEKIKRRLQRLGYF